MKVKIKNKRSLIAIAIILAFIAIGGVIAYHTSKGLFFNDFGPVYFQWSAVDEFVSPNNWKHCDRTPKVVKATNTGRSPAFIRIKLEEYWKKNGSTSTTHETELPLSVNGTRLTYYNLNQSNEWELQSDGWYHYARPIEAGEETTPLITYVDFSCEAQQIFENNDCETINGQTVCTNNHNDYGNAKYHLYATVEGSTDNDSPRPKIAKLEDSYYINTYMKSLANDEYVSNASYADYNIRAIKTADSLPTNVDIDGWQNDLSAYNSKYPIYDWFDASTGTIYIYTEADYIEAPSSLEWAFAHLHNLTDISGLANWHTSKVTSMYCMFYESNSIQNIDALAKWDTSNNTSLSWTFHTTTNLTNISGLANWRTDKVSNFYNTLANSGFTDTTPLLHWNTASGTEMGYMFYNTPITNTVGLTYWDVSHVTSMGSMFSYCDIRNMNGFRNWDASGIVDAGQMFANNYNVTSLAPIFNWKTTSLIYTSGMFSGIPDSVTRPAWYQ